MVANSPIYRNSLVKYTMGQNEIEAQKHNPFQIELKFDGNLEATDEYAQANIDFY